MEPVHPSDSSPANPSSPRRKWPRRLGWCVVWIATILVLASALLSAYAKHRYNAALALAKSVGVPDSLEQVLPKAVPEEDNFGAIDDFKPLLAVEEVDCPITNEHPFGKELKMLDPAGVEALKRIKPLKITAGSIKAAGPFQARGTLADLRNQALEEKRLSEDSSGLSDAEAVLKVFEHLDLMWGRLHAAKRRAHALWICKNLPLFGMNPPNSAVSVTLAFSNIAQIKARAHIEAQRGAEALEECLLLLKLADLRAFASLLENLVRCTEIGLLLPALHEGISRHVWSDAQLSVLETALARYDLLFSLREAFKTEGLYPQQIQGLLHSSLQSGGTPAVVSLLSFIFGPGAEPGLVGRFVAAGFGKTILNLVSAIGLEMIPHELALLEKEGRGDLRVIAAPPGRYWWPLNRLADMFSAPGFGVVKSVSRTQTFVNMSRVAIALERHRLGSGTYPAAIAELVPGFMSAIPVEVFDGAPLHYRLNDGGTGYTLYSTGWKGTDDGGAMDWSKPDQTNWTWITP